jgi:UDP-glucose 4-epimerase
MTGWLDSHAAAYAGESVCVTGGGGFIGSHIVDALEGLGAKVTVIDDFSNGRHANLDRVRDRIRVIGASILDAERLAEAMEGARTVFHLAAIGSVPGSLSDPVRYHEVNATGTIRVLEAARHSGAKRLVYSASSSAYGDTPTLPKIETMKPDPRSPYAVTKIAGEHACRAWSLCFGLSTVSLRYFNIFGRRQRPDSQYAAVIPVFASCLRQGQQPTIFGDGQQTRDFTHVDNAVHANLCAGAAAADLRGEMVNIGCGANYTLTEVLDQMNAVLATKVLAKFAPARAGDVRDSLASIERARELIGYEPVRHFADGLRDTLCGG